MARIITFQLSLSFIGILCFCVQAHNPDVPGEAKEVHHGGIARNKEHIKEHLDYLDAEQVQNITDKETEFLFFNSHDYNKDKLLDGLEILSSLLHTYAEEDIFGDTLEEDGKSEEEINQIRQNRNSKILDYSTGVLDNILALSDLNDDGYIDYVEYSHAQELEQLVEAENKQKLFQQQQEQQGQQGQQEKQEQESQQQHEQQQHEQQQQQH